MKTAQEVLERLLKGNQNFMNSTPTAENMCLKTLQGLKDEQQPYAIILSCSDSRVVPEIIFDTGIGELFVIRVAGITAGPNIIESIEYGVKALNIPLLLLLGHDDCGVMKYANSTYPQEPQEFKTIMASVYPVLDGQEYKKCHNDVAKRHTAWVKHTLLEKSQIIKNAFYKGEVKIVKAHFDHHTGKVEIM